MKQKGLHRKSEELWFHIMIWCHPKNRLSRFPLATPLFLSASATSGGSSEIAFWNANAP